MNTLNRRLIKSIPPAKLFALFAFAEMVTWAGLITALILRATGVTATLVTPAGGIHGFIFLCYCVTTVFVWVNQRWKPGVGVVGLLSAIIPFATVPFELSLKKKGQLTGDWRLGPEGSDTPQGFIEILQAWVLKNLLIAIVLGLIIITTIFITLLFLGPPELPTTR